MLLNLPSILFFTLTGFVDFSSLMKIPLMKYYKPDMVLHHIQHSVSSTGRNRFEKKEENGRLHVRAVYGRRMERVSTWLLYLVLHAFLCQAWL